MVQQTHPLARLMVSPSIDTISLASILIAPKSFTRTAIRRPDRFDSIWFSSEVFPDPRNPPTIVNGTGGKAIGDSLAGPTFGAVIVLPSPNASWDRRLCRGFGTALGQSYCLNRPL